MLKQALVAALTAAVCATFAWPRSGGPDPRLTGAPGDAPQACTLCHGGSLNSGRGSVKLAFPGGTVYQPGQTHHLTVEVNDPEQQRWGFQLTARFASDPANGQAGEFTSTNSFTQVICEAGGSKPCAPDKPVQFIEHTREGTRNGTSGGVTFDFDWTAPAAGAGKVVFYLAANAANGNNNPTGDHIYTATLEVEPGQSGAETGGIPLTITRYIQRNLVSDVAGAAEKTDSNLVNPWGIGLNPSGPFWLANNRTGAATVYNGAGEGFPADGPLVVRIPPAAGSGAASTPTGQVFNGTEGFPVAPGKPARFLFAAEDGTISGWNPEVDGANAITVVDNSGAGAVYKGLALGANSSGPVLYAANFSAGTIDAFDAALKPVATAGGFKDPDLPAGFAPFNVQKIGRRLYVTYARQDAARRRDVPGDGSGFVNVFDMDGNLRRRLVSAGALNSPWGMALAPAFFGDYSNTLLIGNFGDGRINAFDIATGDFIAPLTGADGNPIAIDGLWALQFGNGKSGGDPTTLYFTAGPQSGEHGLFGSVQPAP